VFCYPRIAGEERKKEGDKKHCKKEREEEIGKLFQHILQTSQRGRKKKKLEKGKLRPADYFSRDPGRHYWFEREGKKKIERKGKRGEAAPRPHSDSIDDSPPRRRKRGKEKEKGLRGGKGKEKGELWPVPAPPPSRSSRPKGKKGGKGCQGGGRGGGEREI